MKKRLIISIVLILALAFTFASCSNKRIDSIEIASGTAPTEVYVDEQPDFSAMKLIVKYNDGTTREIAASEATIGTVDTSKPGRVSYSISYEGFSVNASITVKAKGSSNPPITQATLTGITYLSGLNTSLFVGGELDTTVLKVTATYSDGSTKTVESKDLTTNISAFDKFKVGTQTLVITYGDKSCSVNITVQAVKVVDLTLDYSTIDTSKTYFVGDTVDTTKLTGKAIYNNGTTKDLVSSDFTFSTIDNTTAGKKTLAITYEGITKNLEFSFQAVAPISLAYANGTVPAVLYGDQLDTSAITAILKYNNGTTKALTASDLTFTDIDTATPGEKALTATYEGFSFTVPYTVLDITDAEVIGASNEVKLGSTDIDCTGVQLKLTLSDGSTKLVAAADGVTVDKTAFSAASLGKTSITVKYKDESVLFEIDVVEIVGTLESIEITGGLVSSIYEGYTFSTDAITLLARFSGNQVLNLDRNRVDILGTVDTATPGTYTLTVKFTYDGVTKECTHTVTVNKLEITNIEVLGINKEVKLGSTDIDCTGAQLKLTFNDGSTKLVAAADGVTVDKTAFSAASLGKTSITVKYKDESVLFEIDVVEIVGDPTFESIEITGGLVASIYEGHTFSTDDIKLIAKFSDNQILNLDRNSVGLEIINNVNPATPGTYTLTVKFTYDGVTKECTHTVTVLGITGIEVIGVDSKVKLNSSIDFSGVQLKLTFSDDWSELVTAADGVTVDTSNFSTASLGKTSITVTYKDKSVSFDIDVVEIVGTLESIEIAGGLVSSIYEGQTFSTDAITLLARFSGNQSLHLDRSRVEIMGDVITTTPGTYTLTVKFTYDDVTKECTHTVTVTELRVTNLVLSLDHLEVERYPLGSQPNLGSLLSILTATAHYNDGSQRNLILSDLTLGTVDLFTAGTKTLTVSFEEGSAAIQVTVKEPTVTDVKLVGEFANKHIKGEAYDKSGAKAEVHYSNGEVVILENALSNAAFDEATGVLSVTFAGKSASKSIELLTVTSVAIDTETINTAPELNKFSTDGLELIVYLSDGSNVRRNVSHGVEIDASAVNAEVSGIYDMTASYMDVTSRPVKIFVIEDDRYVITGAADPEGIALWKANTLQENFLDKGYKYAVGTANPFRFEIQLIYRDKETDELFTKYLAYTGVSKVYDEDGNEVGEDIVVIDDVNHTFHFTSAALGNTYRITTRPKKIAAGAEILFTRELWVEIVDGFNVHDELELNVLTNATNKEIGESGYDQFTTLYEFMKNNVDFAREMTMEEYTAFVNSFNGIVLHDFLALEPSDFPEKYFFITKDGTNYLWDHFALFYHEFFDTDTFNFYGNYFEIETSGIPCVAPAGTYDRNNVQTNNTAGDPTSNSEVFRFRTADAILDAAAVENPSDPESNPTFDHTDYKANFYALAMSDNDKSVAEQEAEERLRSTLGIYAFKIAKAEYNFYAVNIQRYYMSVMNEYDCLTVNYDYCTFHDSWNNHISIWAENTIDEGDDDQNANIHKGHTPIKVNITNSFMAKCGGPVIISTGSAPTLSRNQLSGPVITVDENSVLYSYVTGEESWFINYSATAVVGDISNISRYFFAPNGAQFTTNITSSGKDFINMIFLNLSSGGLANPTEDVDGSITIGGKTLLDMNDTSIYLHPVTGQPTQGNYADAYVDTVMAGAKLLNPSNLPPIFVSSEGGHTHFNGTTLDKTMGDIFKGDRLAFYYFNMGILVGYNEKQIAKEPEQRECAIVRITEAHGYSQAN